MACCSRCGANNAETSVFCTGCGAPLKNAGTAAGTAAPVYIYNANPQPTPYPTGGLLAWSIITLLLCMIPGIIAIVKTTNINSSLTVQEQQRQIRGARTWCIVGTVLGLLGSIGSVLLLGALGLLAVGLG